jgi:hypothetical protein
MMERQPLGRLESVDLRDYWLREDTDFTPWMAEPENLKLLGKTLGMNLEFKETESPVGPFRADIVCQDINSGCRVLIENQIEQTDHAHLGQLMTYAAGKEASLIVWISKKFNEQHRAALEAIDRRLPKRVKILSTSYQALGNFPHCELVGSL